jgi:hypothetical protein
VGDHLELVIAHHLNGAVRLSTSDGHERAKSVLNRMYISVSD